MSRHPHLAANVVRLKRLGIDTYQEPVIYLAADSPVCQSEGWQAESRVLVSQGAQTIVATLNVMRNGLLGPDEAGLSDAAWTLLQATEGNVARLAHAPPPASMSHVRGRAYHEHLDPDAITAIITDIAAGSYSAIELAAFVTAFAGKDIRVDEITALTRAMIDTGERLDWGRAPIVDKHCVGGVPGNRTSMIVVPIVAACGLTIPKTSSRAITSPAGTADAMATIAPVDFDLPSMRRIVEREGACIVWGGRVRLSPADDIIIRVEAPLDFDSVPQLVASVLSKKAAAGSTHVVIDVPVGPTAKVRSTIAAAELERTLVDVGAAIGLCVHPMRTDGSAPVGHGMGPALEARDVLAVLRGSGEAPLDLRKRAIHLAAAVLELGGRAAPGRGLAMAHDTLTNGAALRKFEAICAAQGGMREPERAPLVQTVKATRSGTVTGFDLRLLSRIAKLAGAPRAPAAGLELHVALGTRLLAGNPLMTLHAQAGGPLEYARAFAAANPAAITVEPT